MILLKSSVNIILAFYKIAKIILLTALIINFGIEFSFRNYYFFIIFIILSIAMIVIIIYINLNYFITLINR